MKELNLLRAENAILREKARILDVLMTSDSLFTTRVVAESMGKSVKWLNDYLQEKKIQVKEKGQWKISRKYRDNGFVKKSQKLPAGEFARAKRYKEDYERRARHE